MAWHAHLIQTYADDRFRVQIKLDGVYREEDGHRMVELAFKLMQDKTKPQKLETIAEKDVVKRADGLFERTRVYTVYRKFSRPWQIVVRCDRKMVKM